MSAYVMSGVDRHTIADQLYRDGGSEDASHRCEVNARYGSFDLLAEILQETGLHAGQHVSDIACGSGQHLQAYGQRVGESGLAVGFDFSPHAVDACRLKGLNVCVADAGNIPLPSASMDILTCNYAIYYMPDLVRVLKEWARVLKPGGILLVSGPAADSNNELYLFHQAITGCAPSDVDRMALGYVETHLPPWLVGSGFEAAQLRTWSNVVTFPDRNAFLSYWMSTSLFLSTVPHENREAAYATACQMLSPGSGMVVTKRVTVLTTRRTGALE